MTTSIRSILAASLILACGAASASTLGCHRPTEPTSPNNGLDKPVKPPHNPDLGHGASRPETDTHYAMYIDEAVPRVCTGPSPYFTFDLSKPKDSAPTMQTLANCMIDGPLKGKSIRLVGHTDPRGTEGYNDKLGLKRADDVKRYLVAQGVAGDRIETATKGEDQASGAEKDWATDRRVEIQLVK